MILATLKINTPFPMYRFGIMIDHHKMLDVNLLWRLFYQKSGTFRPNIRADLTYPSTLSSFLQTHLNPLWTLQKSWELYLDYSHRGDLNLIDGSSIIWNLDNKNCELAKPIDEIHCYRDFFSHEQHVKTGFAKRGEEIPPAWYEMPVYYKGATAGFIGPGEEILWPTYTHKLDYELELGIVMARDGINIPASEAMKYVLGFTILNDISARDIQKSEMAVRLGPAKGKDFCSIIGPVIVTVDDFQYQTPNLRMRALVNGQVWSEGHSGDAHWDFSEMIEHASRDEWVCATDFFGSGTVGTGCGLEIDRWIQPGDLVELEIDNIGTLRNKVGKPRK